MESKLTWHEMKKQYPNEWLLITEYDTDESGNVLSGIVARHSAGKDEVYRLPTLKQSSAFKYTGENTFPGGFRAHAEHHHF